MKEIRWGELLIVLWLVTLMVAISNLMVTVRESAENIVNAISAQQCDHTTHPPVVEIGEVVECSK